MECIRYINDLDIEIKTLKLASMNVKNIKDVIEIKELVDYKKQIMEEYKNNLSKLSDYNIEYRIYFKILNGSTPTKAVEEVAEENYQKGIIPNSVNRIWTKNYRKLKEILSK